jgi:O-antigen/teichoic acid export membrane protein
VMFPAMSAVQDDQSRVRWAYLRTISVVAMVVVPGCALLVVASHPFVIGVLGKQWGAAIPVLRVFAIVAAIQSIGTTTGWLFQVTGNTTRMFRVTIVLTALVIAAFVIGVQWGLMGVVYSYLAWNAISLPVNAVYAGRAVSLRLRATLGAIGSSFAMSLVLCGLLAVANLSLPSMPQLARLAVLVVLAAVFYCTELAVIRPVALRDLRSAIADMRHRPVAVDGAEVIW